MVPLAASEHHDEQDRITNVVLASVRRLWGRMRGRHWETMWRESVGPRMVEVVTEGQQTAAAIAEVYTAALLAELGIDATSPAPINLPAFADVAGDGRPVGSLLYGGVIKAAKAMYGPEVKDLAPDQVERLALADAQAWLEQTVDTILADAQRAAEAVSLAQRPWVEGYVRMLDPKNPCSRCVILAGKFYLWNAGFDRHPACRCVHIPASEDDHESVLTNPSRHFESLSPAEQNKAFTNAGAEAIRLGADPTQVVNARRGMSTTGESKTQQRLINGEAFTVNVTRRQLVPVDVFGRPTFITFEGVTKRGVARESMGSGRPVRLMPESLLEISKDRDDAIRLLKLYGYIT